MQEKPISIEFIAEFIGTFLFIVLGMGCAANLKISGETYSQCEISMLWGMSVTIAVYITRNISGAHLNPSITIALTVFKNFPKNKILPYIIAQMLGAFAASSVIYYLYSDLFVIKTKDTAKILVTFPHTNLSFFNSFIIELFITAIFVSGVFAICDEKNSNKKTTTIPILIGILVCIIGSAFGSLTGFSMNAARDFSPRFFAFLVGWATDIMISEKSLPYFIIPLSAPIIGGLIGAFFYTKILNKV